MMIDKAKMQEGKLFSVLGDSVSTLGGYSEPPEAAFYSGAIKFRAGVTAPGDTWWGKVISRLGGELLVNNSIQGSMVCKHPDCIVPSYACSDERTSALGRHGISPDIIMIFMGLNDWGMAMKPRPEGAEEGSQAVFSAAYASMLKKLRASYPQAELWCFTLPVSVCKSKAGFAFPYRFGGRHIEEYCEVIRACAEEHGCRLVDLYRAGTLHDTIDGFHPNAEGMQTLAEAVLSLI